MTIEEKLAAMHLQLPAAPPRGKLRPAIRIAPRDRVTVVIIGNNSGVKPTASAGQKAQRVAWDAKTASLFLSPSAMIAEKRGPAAALTVPQQPARTP